jgi:hypothetical protein
VSGSAKTVDDLLSPLCGTRGHGEGMPRGRERLGSQPTHLAGPRHEDVRRGCREALHQPAHTAVGESAVGSRAGVGPDSTAEADRPPEQLVENRSGGSVSEGGFVRGPRLAEQLFFGEHRRIEPRDDVEDATDRPDPCDGLISRGLVLDAHELDPMACLEDDALVGGERAKATRNAAALVRRMLAEGPEPDVDAVERRGRIRRGQSAHLRTEGNRGRRRLCVSVQSGQP